MTYKLSTDSENPMIASFMRDIIANPDDDTPRLVLADWLEENGDEARGKFIRAQCQKEQAMRVEQELLKKHGEKWLTDVFGAEAMDFVPVVDNGGYLNPFSRGFVDVARCTVEQLHSRFDGWMAATPLQKLLIRDMDGEPEGEEEQAAAFKAVEDRLREITKTPLFRNVRHLTMEDTYNEQPVYEVIFREAGKITGRTASERRSIYTDEKFHGRSDELGQYHGAGSMPDFLWDRSLFPTGSNRVR